MADETEHVLRRSLDAVDRHRKRLIAGLVFTGVLLLVTFISGARAAHADGGMVQAVLAHFFMLLIWVTALTLVVVIQITVMTKRILRAIELALRK
jgi:archaellum biogenesis protein FlaJ (TadC family)